MTEDGVYQTFNAGKLLKRINQPKGSSHYYIIIYEKEMEIIKPHQLLPDIMNYNDYYEDIKNVKKINLKKKKETQEN